MKNFFLISLIFTLTACTPVSKNTEVKNDITEILEETSFPVILDTIDMNVFEFLKKDTLNIQYLKTAKFKFLYIGESKDTLYIRHFLSSIPPPPPPHTYSNIQEYNLPEYQDAKHENRFGSNYIEWDNNNLFKNPDNSIIEITVNSQNSINNSYPTIIKNFSKGTVRVGYGDYLPIIMEAKDSSGVWSPIQTQYKYMCGNGVGTIILFPNEVVLTSAPIFSGDYETELRLKFNRTNITSNTFKGQINYSQFYWKP